jgi:hypothetical protein
MNKRIFDMMYEFIKANDAWTDYTIKGYYGFTYLTIHWYGGIKYYRFDANNNNDDVTIKELDKI